MSGEPEDTDRILLQTTNLPGPHRDVRKAGLDAIGICILDLPRSLECQESFGLELVFSVGVVAVVPERTRFARNIVETELGLDLLHAALVVAGGAAGARRLLAFGLRRGFGLFPGFGGRSMGAKGARRR